MTPGMEEEEETGRQLPRGRLQWFLMLDYRWVYIGVEWVMNDKKVFLYVGISNHSL